MFEQLKNLLVDELQIDENDITPQAELVGDLGINSIELADLVMICEDKFDIEIDDNDIQKFTTVKDVVDYLESIKKD
jgi:acyl carrier protein